jgi:5-methylcytosine-specific restriction endonuclease McrA
MNKLCPQGHDYRGSRCPKCIKTKRNHGATYGWKWDQLSRRYRIDNPLCEDCDKNGRIEPSREVHHIVPLEVDPSLKYTLSNLVALCRGCHSRRHKELRGGDGPPTS